MRAARPTPVWETRRDGLRLVASGATLRPAGRIAILVGTLVSAVNQGETIANGGTDRWTLLRCVFNYCVPVTVASTAYLAGCRRISDS